MNYYKIGDRIYKYYDHAVVYKQYMAEYGMDLPIKNIHIDDIHGNPDIYIRKPKNNILPDELFEV